VLYEGIAIKLMGFMRSTNHNNPTTPKGDKSSDHSDTAVTLRRTACGTPTIWVPSSHLHPDVPIFIAINKRAHVLR
jgi:hypothetical protein